MAKFQSDFSTAEEIATGMQTALNHIQQATQKMVTEDDSSNLSVVTSASSIETMLLDAVKSYNSGLTQVMDNIKAVAQNFEDTDTEAGKQFKFNDVVKNTSTYGNAIKGK